jgi:hypothetical protein
MSPIDRDALMRLTKAELLDQFEAQDIELEEFRDAQEVVSVDFDRDALMNRTKAQILDQVESQLEDQQIVHGQRLRAQADSVMNLLGGRGVANELAALQSQIVDLQKRLELALEENKILKGETTSATNINVSYEAI